MSTNVDLVLGALSDAPATRAAIAEATGLELTAISVALNSLQKSGHAVRAEGGWISGEGRVERVRRHVAADAMDDAGEPPKKRRGRKPASAPIHAPPRANGRTLEFALSESGEILMRSRNAGGDWKTMPRADAEALVSLVARAAP